jgi:hypothetical protein
MVHEKKKSGDPDYDDKVPAGDQIKVVRAGDGTEVARLDPALGPVNALGEHVNLVDPKAEELDTRPAPGEVAEVKAEVQTYDRADVPKETVSVQEALTPEDTAPAKAYSVEAPKQEDGGMKTEASAAPKTPRGRTAGK